MTPARTLARAAGLVVFGISAAFDCTSTTARTGTTGAMPAEAAPRDCSQRPFDLVIDVGHDPKAFGATSARGLREFDFNRRFSEELVEMARQHPYVRARLLSPDRFTLTLKERAALAEELRPDLLISVHHDSAQSQLLKFWDHDGARYRISREIAGFSMFISRANPNHRRALAFAEQIASAWIGAGHKPTLHHAANIEGERRALLRPLSGIYLAPFAIVHRTRMPALLLEVGVLINPDEEKWLLNADNRQTLQNELIEAVSRTGCSR